MANTRKTPGIANFRRGDTRKYRLTVRSKETQEPICIDGGKLSVTFKKKRAQSDAQADLSVIMDALTDDTENPTGQVLVVLPADKTAVLDPGKYYYDFQFVSNEGEVTTLLPTETMEDQVTILEDVTIATE